MVYEWLSEVKLCLISFFLEAREERSLARKLERS